MLIAGAFSIYSWKVIFWPVSTSLTIDILPTAGAALAFIIALAADLHRPKKYSELIPFLAYVILAASAAYLVVINHYAPVTLTFWAMVAILAGIFRGYGIIPIFIAGNYYLFMSIIEGAPSPETLLVTLVTGWLPVLAGYVLWRKNSHNANRGASAIDSLANELSEVTSQSEVVIRAIADGVIDIDGKGVIKLINPAAQRISGWSAQDATSLSYKSVFKLFDSSDQPVTDANDPVQQVLASNKQVEISTLSLAGKSNKKILVSVVVSPAGQPGSGAIIVFRDITKEKQEEREMAEFISTASHEMRTPVASIEGYLGLALNPNTAVIDDKARDFITKAHESAQHLGRLFQDLLDVSKADDGRLSNTPKVVDVAQFAGTIVEGLRPQAEAKQLRLVYKPGLDSANDLERRLTPIFYANVDNDHLREVVANLTENAIKYTPQGDIIIDISGDESHVVISFKDSGIGIPAEDIQHLFQKFYRVDNSDTREIGGTGLGLYLCRRLVEIMGGRIWVESEYKQGSTFYLEIPRISHEEANHLIEQAIQAAEGEQQSIITEPTQTPVEQSPAEPQVATTPVSVTAPAPAPAQQPIAPPTQTPVAAPPTNTPLSSIEQHPEYYTQQVARAQSVNIPARDPRRNN